MLENIEIVKLASSMARHAASRHSLIAQNIANADTPGYQARDLAAFDPSQPSGFRAAATDARHFQSANQVSPESREVDLKAGASPNGNFVSLEDQMVRSAEVRHSHEMALTIYRKSLDFLRIGIGRVR